MSKDMDWNAALQQLVTAAEKAEVEAHGGSLRSHFQSLEARMCRTLAVTIGTAIGMSDAELNKLRGWPHT